MIGSHDTFTYLNPCFPGFKLFNKIWKTQEISIEDQYNLGVKFFDIRVVQSWLSDYWIPAHGVCNLCGIKWESLRDICYYMSYSFPDAIYRIVLEREDSSDIDNIFKAESTGLCKEFPNLWRIDIKSSKKWLGEVENNNTSLYTRGYKFAKSNTWEGDSHELHGYLNKSNWWKMDFKKEAKKICSDLSGKIDLSRKDELYFLDYVNFLKP